MRQGSPSAWWGIQHTVGVFMSVCVMEWNSYISHMPHLVSPSWCWYPSVQLHPGESLRMTVHEVGKGRKWGERIIKLKKICVRICWVISSSCGPHPIHYIWINKTHMSWWSKFSCIPTAACLLHKRKWASPGFLFFSFPSKLIIITAHICPSSQFVFHFPYEWSIFMQLWLCLWHHLVW